MVRNRSCWYCTGIVGCQTEKEHALRSYIKIASCGRWMLIVGNKLFCNVPHRVFRGHMEALGSSVSCPQARNEERCALTGP
eukprot:3305768-Amphidinium_carterae.1